MAEIRFTETPATLGISVEQVNTIASELSIMQASMEATKEVFELKLTTLISSLQARGMSEEQVINVLLDDLNNDGAIFGGLKRQLIGDAQGMLDASESELTTEEFQRQSGEELGTWVAILVATCDDCLPRHGITRPYSEWRSLGLPASGFSVCGKNCKCEIFPASVVESKQELQLPLKRTKGKITQIAKEKNVVSVKRYVNRKLGSINNTKDPIRGQIRKFIPGFKR